MIASEVTILYRPIGAPEYALLVRHGFAQWPVRHHDQPLMHPVTREIILAGARGIAADAFAAFYRLEDLRRVRQVERRLIGGDRNAHGAAAERAILRRKSRLLVAEDEGDALAALGGGRSAERRLPR